jgi:hypothetical protein
VLRLAHIVNPLVVTNPRSDLSYAQPVTLRSMQVAREQAIRAGGVDVTHYAAFYAEDRPAVPEDFIATPVLERSVLDCVAPAARAGARKLPLLRDILDRLYAAAVDADYLIYTNIDIGLWPSFYPEVVRLIEAGAEAFVIGRRTLSTEFTSPDDLEQIWAQEGTPHYGFSCFVFPRGHYPAYVLDDSCIGLQPTGLTLAINMTQRTRRFRVFSQLRLTFHLGDDRVWEHTLLDACHRHNERALDRVVQRLSRDGLSSGAADLFARYQSRRSDYVIKHCSSRLTRDFYRALRKAGWGDWVAARYDAVRR